MRRRMRERACARAGAGVGVCTRIRYVLMCTLNMSYYVYAVAVTVPFSAVGVGICMGKPPKRVLAAKNRLSAAYGTLQALAVVKMHNSVCAVFTKCGKLRKFKVF